MNKSSWQENLELFLAEIAKTAALRDNQGGHPRHERGLIRSLDLLTLGLEQEFGGAALNWSQLLTVVRQIAAVDSALAHILAFHYLQIFSLKLYGNAEHYRFFARLTGAQKLFWGNAMNPNDRNVLGSKTTAGLRLNGTKSYCSGSVGADLLLVSAWDEVSRDFWYIVVDAKEPGILVRQDWNAFGQKQTDSGSVIFTEVLVNPEWIILTPGTVKTPLQHLRTLLAQSVLINLYLGLSQGALAAAKEFLAGNKKAWFKSPATYQRQDPHNERRIGELVAVTVAAAALELSIHPDFDYLLSTPEAVTDKSRGELAVKLITAKVAAHKAVMQTTSEIFDITGAASTGQKSALDRFWRNARVHTLHDPLDYKLQDLGNFFLSGEYPVPSAYS